MIHRHKRSVIARRGSRRNDGSSGANLSGDKGKVQVSEHLFDAHICRHTVETHVETLDPQFSKAVNNVTVTPAKALRAIAAHTEVRELLESDTVLKAWGIDSLLIGSYGRQTSRFPAKDVDVFLRLTKLNVSSADPEQVYGAVRDVLVKRYGKKGETPGGRCTLQARSISIDFPDPAIPGGLDEFHIDAVPAVSWGSHWGIPSRDRETWSNTETRWVKTDPVEFGRLTNELATASDSPTVGQDNAYRPIVRLVRQVRHVHLGEDRPGGLYCEIAVYYAWLAKEVIGETYAELLAGTLNAVGNRFRAAATTGLLDPVLQTQLKPELTVEQWNEAADTFHALAVKAKEALSSDKCRAAFLWREILGENEIGQVLPLPDGCDAAGFALSAVTAVGAVGSNQPRGFA